MPVWHNRAAGPEQGGGPALVTAEVQKLTGAWVDVAGDVLHASGGLDVQMAGRQSELSGTDNATASLTLHNQTGDYTPGAAGAGTALRQGMPLRVKETIGRRSFDWFQGTLEQPEAVFGQVDAENVVSATAIDWLGGQDQGRSFISTLGEYILYHGGDELVAYYPLSESGVPLHDVSGNSRPSLVRGSNHTYSPGTGEIVEGEAEISYRDQIVARMDDLSTLTLATSYVASGGSNLHALGFHFETEFSPLLTLSAGQTLTLLAWVIPVNTHDQQMFVVDTNDLGHFGVYLQRDSSLDQWQADIGDFGGGLSGTVNSTVSINYGSPALIGLQFGFTPNVLKLWVGKQEYTGSLTGSAPGSATFQDFKVGQLFNGSIGHVQVYVGTSFDREMFIAQYEHGLNGHSGGLRWQRSDERLLTLAQYAGLTASQCNFDRGVAYLPTAELAGETFRSLVDSVVRTEQGRLFVAGDGRLTFHNRLRTRYDV